MSILNQDTSALILHAAAHCLHFSFYYNQIILFFFVFRFAYIEFADKESVRTAMALDESLFRGRQIKVRFFFPLRCSWALTLVKLRYFKLWLTVKSVGRCMMPSYIRMKRTVTLLWKETETGVFLTRTKKILVRNCGFIVMDYQAQRNWQNELNGTK